MERPYFSMRSARWCRRCKPNCCAFSRSGKSNVSERSVVLGSSEHLRPEDLPEALVERTEPSHAGILRYHDVLNRVKRELILKAVEQAGGNFTEAAKLLDLHPNYLHRLIRNMDLRR